jgi:hypothetical protein
MTRPIQPKPATTQDWAVCGPTPENNKAPMSGLDPKACGTLLDTQARRLDTLVGSPNSHCGSHLDRARTLIVQAKREIAAYKASPKKMPDGSGENPEADFEAYSEGRGAIANAQNLLGNAQVEIAQNDICAEDSPTTTVSPSVLQISYIRTGGGLDSDSFEKLPMGETNQFGQIQMNGVETGTLPPIRFFLQDGDRFYAVFASDNTRYKSNTIYPVRGKLSDQVLSSQETRSLAQFYNETAGKDLGKFLIGIDEKNVISPEI